MSSIPKRLQVLACACVLLSCGGESTDIEQEIVRGLKAFRVTQSANSERRRYPSVVQPAQETRLSFEISGKLKDIRLEVGQRVEKAQVLAEIDPASLELKAQSAQASLDDAQAQFKNARADFERKQQLLEKQYVTQAQFDDAQNTLNSARAQLERAQKQLDLAKQDFSKSKLLAPFQGVVSSIEAKDFAQVSPGDTVIGMYSEGAYEVSFSVPAIIINSLTVGDSALVTFSDLPGETVNGRIKELGARASQVSAFPVVVALDQTPDGLHAGIAADVELTIALQHAAEGFLVPMASIDFSNSEEANVRDHRSVGHADLYVYQADSETVNRRSVSIVGIRGNMVIIDQGLQEGDIVAVAGISYLRDGQRVKLLPLVSINDAG